MSTILLLETATSVCSVALWRDGQAIAARHSDQPNAHSSRLAVFVDELFKETALPVSALDAVCVSSGPGSYTGLRIGVSSAKGYCYALDIPLLAVPTLDNMASRYYQTHPDYDGMVCPMIDARRMECYTALYSRHSQLRATEAEVIEIGTYDTWLQKGVITFVGDGAEKTRPLLSPHANARYDSDFRIDAAGMGPIAEQRLREGRKEDVAYFEPFYLKDFVAKKSVVHGLRPEQQ